MWLAYINTRWSFHNFITTIASTLISITLCLNLLNCVLSFNFHYIFVYLTLFCRSFSTNLFCNICLIYLYISVSVIVNVMDAGAANSSYNKATQYRSPLRTKNSRDDVCLISLSCLITLHMFVCYLYWIFRLGYLYQINCLVWLFIVDLIRLWPKLKIWNFDQIDRWKVK